MPQDKKGIQKRLILKRTRTLDLENSITDNLTESEPNPEVFSPNHDDILKDLSMSDRQKKRKKRRNVRQASARNKKPKSQLPSLESSNNEEEAFSIFLPDSNQEGSVRSW